MALDDQTTQPPESSHASEADKPRSGPSSEEASERHGGFSPVEFGEKLFQWRDFTPIPLILMLFAFCHPTPTSACFGTLMLVCGELFRVYSVAFIGSVSRTRSSSTGGSLIQEGPFGYVRNPLYIGNFIIAVGVAVFGNNWFVTALTIGAFVFQYFCIVKYEETLLEQRFGDEYRLYKEKVPAWFPRRMPNLDELEWPTTFSPAIKSEKRTLTAIVTIVAVLLLLSPVPTR